MGIKWFDDSSGLLLLITSWKSYAASKTLKVELITELVYNLQRIGMSFLPKSLRKTFPVQVSLSTPGGLNKFSDGSGNDTAAQSRWYIDECDCWQVLTHRSYLKPACYLRLMKVHWFSFQDVDS